MTVEYDVGKVWAGIGCLRARQGSKKTSLVGTSVHCCLCLALLGVIDEF
jgi:hypothetical protein